MVDRNLIITLYNKGHSYASIGRIMNVSRQRIHAIVKNYSHVGRKSRSRLYKDFKLCKICYEPAIALHHIDKNNANNNPENLLPVCKNCHIKLHKLTQWSRKYKVCIECKTTERKHANYGYCKRCWDRKRYVPIKNRVKKFPI